MLLVNCKTKPIPINNGDLQRRYFTDIRKYKPLSDSEQKKLLKTVKFGNEVESSNAREKLILHNQRIVISVAKHLTFGDDFNDLVSEGTIGLNKAIDKFDPRFQQQFITYAMFWINKYMTDYLTGNSKMLVPKNANKVYAYIPKANNKFFLENGRYPYPEELHSILDENGIVFSNKEDLFSLQITSVDETLLDMSDKHEMTFNAAITKEYFEKTASNDMDGIIEKEYLMAKVKGLLSNLDETQRYILMRYYGIECEAESFFAMAGELGMDEKSVIKQYNKALKKLHKIVKF